MPLRIKARYYGPLFQKEAAASAIEAATKDALDYGRHKIASYTPVRTGYLQDNWEDDAESMIYNEVPYSVYVEEGTSRMRGRFMAQKSLREIGRYYEEAIETRLNRLF